MTYGGISDEGAAFLKSSCYGVSAIGALSRPGERFRGVVLPIFGGDLYGWYCIGGAHPGGWTTPDGVMVERFAAHQNAQCAQVAALDGRVGVSWSREFLPRYSHVDHIIEASALWASFRGWVYADVLRCNAGTVLQSLAGVVLVPVASGEYIRWWRAEDYAVYVEPPLTSSDTLSPKVYVLARNSDVAATIQSSLEDIDASRASAFVSMADRIGEAFPPVPTKWGQPEPFDVS